MTREQEREMLKKLNAVSRACGEATEAFAKVEAAIATAMDACLGIAKDEVGVPVESADDF